jgi:PBSX family phage terminase large subunit
VTEFHFEYRPIPVHEPFHRCTAYEAVMFGGYGSGKSYALCAEAIALGLEQPGSEILVCRKTVPALRDTTEAIFVGLLPPKFFDACKVKRMGGHYESITFPNGTKYMFRGLDDWMKLKSLSLAGIFFDEVDEFDEETYMGMSSRVRQTRPRPQAQGARVHLDRPRPHPVGLQPAGHNWVWKRFVNEPSPPNTAFFTSTSLDNPFLPLDYIDSLLAMPDPWVRRYVLCGFDDFAGQIYESWTWESHVIAPYMSYDPASFLLMGMDPGTSKENPTAGLWCYYDKERHWLVGVAEYQAHSLSAKTHANAWRTIETRFGRARVRQRASPTPRSPRATAARTCASRTSTPARRSTSSSARA